MILIFFITPTIKSHFRTFLEGFNSNVILSIIKHFLRFQRFLMIVFLTLKIFTRLLKRIEWLKLINRGSKKGLGITVILVLSQCERSMWILKFIRLGIVIKIWCYILRVWWIIWGFTYQPTHKFLISHFLILFSQNSCKITFIICYIFEYICKSIKFSSIFSWGFHDLDNLCWI